MNRGTTKAHIAHAALASIAQQDADILEIMQKESGYQPEWLFVDGGPTRQPAADANAGGLRGCVIRSADASELSALGAAYIAGIKMGIYRDFESIPARQVKGRTYAPKLTDVQRNELRQSWKSAVRRALSGQ